MLKDSSPRKRVRSKKAKTLADELSLKERRDLGLFAIIIVISTILSGLFAPQFGVLAEQKKWLEFILLGVLLALSVFLLLGIAVAIMKRHWKKKYFKFAPMVFNA